MAVSNHNRAKKGEYDFTSICYVCHTSIVMRAMKKLIAVVLSGVMFFSVMAPTAFASGTVYSAQVLHASGVNDYGTNIHDEGISDAFDVPLTIRQNNGVLVVSGEIDGNLISFEATPRGKNGVGNMIYFDTNGTGSKDISVLTMMYLDTFSSVAIISDSYDTSCTSVLKLYLKDTSSLTKEYYFIEIFGFSYAGFDSVINTMEVCESDHWNSKEFLPISINNEESPTIVPYATSYDKTRTITETYADPANLTFKDTMQILLVHDVENVPQTGSATWIHAIQVKNKYSVCVEDSSFSDYTGCPMQLKNVHLKAIAPKNTAFISTMISGTVTKLASVTTSASLGVALGSPIAAMTLSATYSTVGQVNLNSTYSAYTNASSTGYTRNVKVALNSNCVLRNVGDRFVVTNSVRNYGSGTTTSETTYASWNWTTNHYLNMTNSAGTQTQAFSCRVV